MLLIVISSSLNDTLTKDNWDGNVDESGNFCKQLAIIKEMELAYRGQKFKHIITIRTYNAQLRKIKNYVRSFS